ncbi:MAG TPA: DUF3782 domain-containing protein [Thermoanaerobaculia bacterium]|nr:DUF3782 domain-containing protein [Thermoanaerobaculia bacterium]
MTDQELRDLMASLAVKHAELTESQRETERVLREAAQEYARLAREETRELKRQIGGLSDKFGSFTEGLALPSMAKILSQRFGMEVIAPSVRVKRNGHSMEVDVLAFSNFSDDMFVVEVKSHLREEALDQMNRILQEFRDFFPIYKDKKVYGIIAAVHAPGKLQEKVLQEGFYFARIHDDQFQLDVPESFQPRVF